ncbi:glycosyltransferase family 2 protein [Ruminococcus gauvreauii]|uniref:Glycosyltransferase family 2 protein n=1 Tax=Ruminococcus gauvreauii TaxID=438033 RepID=A0ABY5VDU3_9FIRM|nr:glycosyltransferase family 2 protein [Ruminococcus gauvreauii]UWP58769.1 glycosyltransferase family 2 protein [Ruminococcus gauvreauii]
MKLLTVTVPCYNSQEYMSTCIESLLKGGDEVEIVIVDDGSTDDTPKIADEYARKYPSIIKVIHQENGGHGEAVNTGLANAGGLYFKVVDSDDWVSESAYKAILEILKKCLGGPETLDMLISNYVYEKVGARHKRVMRYPNALPQGRIFGWDEVKPLGKSHYLLMHSLIYRTELLRECGLKLPKHTFYVDNLVAFIPFPYVKHMYYADVNFYRYYIGRVDQSVNESVMIRRVDQQLMVNRMMIDCMAQQKSLNKHARSYMMHALSIIMTVSSVILLRSGTDENLAKKSELWRYLKAADGKTYLKLRYGLLGRTMNLPGKGGRKFSITAYKIVQRIYGFN